MEWTNVNEQLPKKGYYIVTFLIEVLGDEKPFEDIRLYAAGSFNPEIGWKIDNRYVHDYRYEQPYISNKLRVTDWMPLPEVPVDLIP